MTHCERLLAALADGEWHDHHELYGLHMIVHSRVADLRRQGHTVEQRRNGDLYEYRLVRTLDETQASSPRGADGGLRLVERPSPPPPGGALTEASASFSPGPTLQLDLFGTAA